MNKIVGSSLEDIWIVQSVVQIVSAEIQIVWLVRNKHGIDVNGSDLAQSATVGKAIQHTNLAFLKFFSTLHRPVTSTVAAFKYFLRISYSHKRRKEVVSKESVQRVMLSCQSVFLELVVGYWHTVYLMVNGDLLEHPPMYSDALEVLIHCGSGVYGMSVFLYRRSRSEWRNWSPGHRWPSEYLLSDQISHESFDGGGCGFRCLNTRSRGWLPCLYGENSGLAIRRRCLRCPPAKITTTGIRSR